MTTRGYVPTRAGPSPPAAQRLSVMGCADVAAVRFVEPGALGRGLGRLRRRGRARRATGLRPTPSVRCAGWWTRCAGARAGEGPPAAHAGAPARTRLCPRAARARFPLASHMSTSRRARLVLSPQVSGRRSLRRGCERTVISPRSSVTKDARSRGHGRVTSLAHAVRIGLRSYGSHPSDARRLAVRAASAEARDTFDVRAL